MLLIQKFLQYTLPCLQTRQKYIHTIHAILLIQTIPRFSSYLPQQKAMEYISSSQNAYKKDKINIYLGLIYTMYMLQIAT